MSDDPAPPPIAWLLLARYALLISLCVLIPIPLVDRLVENVLRRRLVRRLGSVRGVTLSSDDVHALADVPLFGCLGMIWEVLVWPIKKVLKTMFFVLQIKSIADAMSEVVHRGLLLEEAFDAGWIPGDATKVRAAMDAALTHVDTRPIERTLRGSLRDSRHALSRVIWESVRVTRFRFRERSAGALADAADADALPEASQLSRAMLATLKVSGLVPELVGWFRAEMGDVPQLEAELPGVIVPELLPAPAEVTPQNALPALVEEAEEVVPRPTVHRETDPE